MSDNITNSTPPSTAAKRLEEIEYSLNADDHVAYHIYLTSVNRGAWAGRPFVTYICQFVLSLVLFSLVAPKTSLAGFPDVLNPERMGPHRTIGVLGLAVLCVTSLWGTVFNLLLILDWMPRSHFEKQVQLFYRIGYYKRCERYRVWMTKDEFIEEADRHQGEGDGVVVTDREESRALWRAVERMDETADHFFFKMAENGYLIVPKRVFSDEEAAQRYLQTAKRLREAFLNRVSTPFGEAGE